MHRTLVGDLEQLLPLFFGQVASKFDIPIDAVQHLVFGVAIRAIDGVGFRMTQPNYYAGEWPLLAPRIHAERHGSAGAQRRRQQLIGGRPGISTANVPRFVREKPMSPDSNLLRESSHASADHYLGGSRGHQLSSSPAAISST